MGNNGYRQERKRFAAKAESEILEFNSENRKVGEKIGVRHSGPSTSSSSATRRDRQEPRRSQWFKQVRNLGNRVS